MIAEICILVGFAAMLTVAFAAGRAHGGFANLDNLQAAYASKGKVYNSHITSLELRVNTLEEAIARRLRYDSTSEMQR